MSAEFAPKQFSRNPEGLSAEGLKLESRALLGSMSEQAERLTPNDAVQLAQRLLVGVDAWGIQQRPDFQSPQAVERYVRKAIHALRGLSLS